MDPAKLKVVELRAELSARGLDTKGVKAVLVDRLKQALKEETGQEVPDTSIVDTSTEDFGTVEEKTSQSEPEQTSETEQTSEAEQERVPTPDQERVPTPEPERVPSPEPERVPSPEPERVPSPEQERVPTPEPEREPTPDPEKKEEEHSKSEEQISEEPTSAEVVEEKNEKENITEDTKMEEVSVKKEPEYEDFKQNFEEKPNFGDYQQGYDDENKEHYEADVKMEPGTEIKEEDQEQDRKRKRSRWSPQQQKQGWGQSTGWTKKDDEPELDDKAVVLGWYDSDLNLVIEKSDFLEAAPLSSQGFGYVWAGCRATFGFNQGKVCFEVKLLENLDVSHLEDEPSPHVLRVGWSVLSASLMLGEEPMSFGYGGTAKASTNCKFNNYGTTFVVGDTVTAYLDYGSRVKISYAVNGKYLGEAFNIPSSQINEQPLFPHLLSKNIKFRVNFGQTETEFPIEAGYTWAANVAEDQRVAGPRRPERREDCEMLMMCGLPGCGKTTWANAFVKEHPDKYYNILGTNSLIEKMKIQGLARKRNYHGRWDVLIDKCTKCLNKLLEMAAGRRRNYILDQTNVYPSAQKRKMRNFGGFVRRAIVIVPTDEEFQRRCAKREAEEGKDIPDSAVLEMKANFRLPEQGEFFDEVRYIELNEEESRPLVEQYNKEGRAAGFGQQAPFSNQGSGGGSGGKRFRGAPPRGGSGGGGFRGGNRGGGGFGGVLDRRGDRPGGDRGGGGFRSGGMDRGGRGGWQPRGGGGDRGGRGGWRDRSPGGGGGYDRDMDNRGPGGGPWRNNRNNDHRDRPYDRNQRGGRGGRGGGGFDRNNFRDNEGGYGGRGGGGFRDNDYNRGGSGSGGSGSGYDRDDYNNRGGGGGGYNQRDSGYNNRDGGFRDGGGRGRGGGGGGRGSFDRDQRGGGRGGFDRNRGGYNDRRGGGGGNRDGGYDRNRGGPDRGPRDNKGGNSGNQNNQGGGGGGGGQGWGNQGYNSGWGQGGGGYNNQQQQQPQGYNQGSGGGYNQGGGGGGFNQGGGGGGGYNQQGNQPPATGWGQQAWANKGGYGTGANQQQPAQAPPTGATPTATPAATGYNTTGGYTPQQTGYNQAQYPQGYWGQYGYGQGWTQNADGTYSYPQGWQQYGYNYGQAGAAAAMATPAAAVGNPAAATQPAAK